MGSTTPFAAVVFDFGGVLISPITLMMEEVAAWHGVPMVEMLEVLMGPRHTSTSEHPWHRAERGELATADLQVAVRPVADAAGLSLRGDEYERLLRGDFVVHEQVLERVARLRDEGLLTALLTNSFKEFRPVLEERIDFSLFDVVVDSSEVGCRKPEPAIYAIATEALGVPPERIVFLDDFEANVEGGRRAGWSTILVADVDVALDELDRLLEG